MAEKKVTTVTTTTDNEVVDRAKGFWEKNSKLIIIAGSAIIALIAGIYAYNEFIKKPNERKANEAIYAAESLFDKMASSTGFNKDSSALVINGNPDLGITGVLKVAKEYGGTRAGNRAEYIAGATYLHLKNFPKAIEHLEDFDANGAHQVKSKAYTMLGHAYAEQNKTDKALEYYEKAAEVNTKDDVTTPDAIFLAASYAEAVGKTKDAIELYTKLRDNYPAYVSVKSGDVDKYLAKLGVLK